MLQQNKKYSWEDGGRRELFVKDLEKYVKDLYNVNSEEWVGSDGARRPNYFN